MNPIDYPAISLLISAANFALTWGLALYMYLANKNKVTNERINTLQVDVDKKFDDARNRLTRLEASSVHDKAIHLEGCCADITERVASLEQHAADAPKNDDLARLHARIDEVSGAIKHIQGESSAQTRILNLVYESLIKGPK